MLLGEHKCRFSNRRRYELIMPFPFLTDRNARVPPSRRNLFFELPEGTDTSIRSLFSPITDHWEPHGPRWYRAARPPRFPAFHMVFYGDVEMGGT